MLSPAEGTETLAKFNDGPAATCHAYGKGKIYWGRPIAEVLAAETDRSEWGRSAGDADRLLRAADELKEPVLAQIGCSTHVPKNCRWERFMTRARFEEACAEADVVVTHGGVGCIATALGLGKPVVAVPRLSRYGEHTNDHQTDIVNELARSGRVIALSDAGNIARAIEEARRLKPSKFGGGRIAGIVRGFLDSLCAGQAMFKL